MPIQGNRRMGNKKTKTKHCKHHKQNKVLNNTLSVAHRTNTENNSRHGRSMAEPLDTQSIIIQNIAENSATNTCNISPR